MEDRCIYSWMTLDDSQAPNVSRRSKEHIVPVSLGGSDSLVTFDVSAKWNNDLGSSVDAPFANLLPLAIKRHQYRLAGESGIIPPIRWKVEASGCSSPATMVITPEGTVDFEFEPSVTTEEIGTYKRMSVGGSPEKVKTIFEGILERAKQRGNRVYSLSGDLIASINEYYQIARAEHIDLFRGRIEFFDCDVWFRGVFKMILGLAHLLAGPTWTFSADGDRIRSVVMQPRERWPKLFGIGAGRVPEPLAECLSIDQAARTNNMHTLAVLPSVHSKRAFAVVSLFGGDGVPEVVLPIGSELGNLSAIYRRDPDFKVGFRIEPRTRKTTPITFREIAKRMSPELS